jgi:hydrogenase maturation protease
MVTSRVLLIGFGNVLRGDDALGPMVVERLSPSLKDVELISCHQLAPELAEPLAHCELALFVDADVGGEPGTVLVQRLSPATEGVASLTHHVQPAALLALARELYGHAPKAILVTGSGASYEGESLSEQGRKALLEISRLIPLVLEAEASSHHG